MGLKDQRMALRWVQTHIGRFGGDAGNVTLFGESAGGVSAHLHSLSEESRPLFQKLICQSGVATSPITFQRDPESKTRRLAEYFGCPADASDSDVLETLMNVKPELLAKSQKEALTPHEKTLDSMYPFRPVIERPDSIDPIVTEPVLDLFRRRKRTTTIVPMIIGVTNEEALYKINTFRQHLQRYQDDPCRFIPDSLNVAAEERSEVAQRIVQFYCGADGVCLEKELELSRIFTDVFYLIPAVQTAEMLLDNQQGPIYFYNFAADTELNKFRRLWKVPMEHRGASHADDVCYLFGSSFFRTDAIGMGTEAWKLRDAMCRMWTDFAKTGVPQLGEDGELEWTSLQQPVPGKSLNLSVLEIGSKTSMVQNHLPERVGFWRDLFMKYNNC
uniref:Carboxylic ester hydrolase n=1 Tax=Anopheles farauti TaxID=69004 RepID=A0A182QSL8_9DIPT